MELALAILSIAAALLVGAMSPGPSFLMVARTALAVSRKDGLAAALGMGVGGVLFSTAALLGLLAILTAIPLLYFALKTVGGAYLIYLGYRIWRGARQALVVENTPQQNSRFRPGRSFLLGLLTQVSNPKTAVVYASVFASLLPKEIPAFVFIAMPVIIFTIETAWYSVVVLALSAPTPRARYFAAKAWLDRLAGGVLAGIGMKLIGEAPQP